MDAPITGRRALAPYVGGRTVAGRLLGAIWPARTILLASVAGACAGSPSEPSSEPLVMQADRLALSDQSSCLIERSGEVVCWGLGGPRRLTPNDGSLRFVALRAGVNHFCALTADSTAYCWGENLYGQLGTASRVAQNRPMPVNTTTKFVAIQASTLSTCALDGVGRAYCWGRNEFEALGDHPAGGLSVEDWLRSCP